MKFLNNILAKAGLIVEGTTNLQGPANAITVASNDNSTNIATTEFVKSQGYMSGITSGNIISSLGYTPLSSARMITINGVSYDLSADRSWSISAGLNARTEYEFTTTLNQTIFTANYTVGQVDVFYNGAKLSSAEFTALNGTSVTLGFTPPSGQLVEVVAWETGGGVANGRTLTINGTTYDLSANRAWTVTDSTKLSLSGGTLVGKLSINTGGTDDQFQLIGTAPSVRLTNAASGATINGFFAMAGTVNSYIQGAVAGDMCIGNQNGGKILIGSGSGTISNKLVLDSTGAALFSSSVTANSIIKSGGTSAQILAADGSVITAGTGISISGGVISSTVTGGVASFNTRTGAIALTSGDVTGALGFTPYNSTNPAGYITGISFANVSAKPTTLSGYGITDAASSTHNHNGTYWPVEGGWKPASLSGSTRLIGKTSPDGGEFALAYSGGQIHAYTDGFFYQNEGQYIVIDSSSIGSQSVSYANSAGTLSSNATISGLNFGGVFAMTASGASTGNSTGARLSESYGPLWNLGNGSTWHHQIINGSSLVGISAGGTNFGSGNIYASGNIVAYYSDMRLKNKISNIENALDKVLSLNGFYYVNNDVAKEHGYTTDKVQVGVSAQEIEAVLPEVVTLAPFDITGNEKGDMLSKSGEYYKTVSYDKIVPLLIEAIKEQQSQIEKLKTIINGYTK